MDLKIGSSGHRVLGSSPSVTSIGTSEDQARSRLASSENTAPTSLELHIGELVLHGFPTGDRFRIGDAVQQELARLIAEQGLPGMAANSMDVARLDVGSFQVAQGGRAQGIGIKLARHLHQHLSPGQRPRRQSGGRKRHK